MIRLNRTQITKDIPEIPDYEYGLRYKYNNEEDEKTVEEGGLNLSNNPRPWDNSLNSRYSFNDAFKYKIVEMKKYIEKYFINNYKHKNSPFIFKPDYYNVNTESAGFSLSPPQKFCGQFISNQTDFPGLLLYHGLGSGKTISSILIAEAVKGKYINEGIIEIKNRKYNNKYCSVTIVVPINIIDQYISDIIGDATKNCIIYSDKNNKGYEQRYIKTDKLDDLYKTLETFQTEYDNLHKILTDTKKEQKERIKSQTSMDKLSKLIDKLNKEIINIKENNVYEIYFIVSVDTFINRLKDKLICNNFEYKIKSTDSSKGKYFNVDCFHSKNSLLIIDEVHKISNSETNTYNTLYNILNKYARNYQTGEKTMKIVLLTATPIYDKPFQIANIINLLRPRAQFPLNEEEFKECFIANDNIKNKLLLKYLLSGYVSYYKGGNPFNYPYRRNHVIYHSMSSLQLKQYSDYSSIVMFKKNEDDDADNWFNGKPSLASSFYVDNITGYVDDDKAPLLEYFKASYKEKSMENFKKIFRQRSNKLYSICDKITDENNIGIIYINAPQTTRHILPIVLYLLKNGYEYLTTVDVDDKNIEKRNRFVVYSDTLNNIIAEYINIFNNNIKKSDCEHNKYKNNLFNFLKDERNINGEYCKIIIGNIEEGVSFRFISQIHICTPWWNEARIEQVVGRGIRINSHTLLPKNKQIVDIYYHISYINEDKFSINSKKLASDEIMYNTTFKKSKLNKQFEKLLKESAIDYMLNKNGNLIRLEEFLILNNIYDKNTTINYETKVDNIFLDRTTDNFYKKINTKYENIDITISNEPKITNLTYQIHPLKEDISYDYLNRKMTTALFNEIYDSDLYNDEINNYTFRELKKYATTVKNEDISAWNKIDKLIINDKLLDILLSRNILKNTSLQYKTVNAYIHYAKQFGSTELNNKLQQTLGLKHQ